MWQVSASHPEGSPHIGSESVKLYVLCCSFFYHISIGPRGLPLGLLQDRVKCAKWCLKKLCASKNLIYSALLHKANTMFALLNYLVEPSLLPRRDYYRFLGGAKGNWTFENFSHDRRNLIIEKWYKTFHNADGTWNFNLKIEGEDVVLNNPNLQNVLGFLKLKKLQSMNFRFLLLRSL